MNRGLWVGFFLSVSLSTAAQDRIGDVQEIAPGVYFHQDHVGR